MLVLILSTFLFIIGLYGMLFSKNHIIIVLMSLELLLLSSMVNFIGFSVFLDLFIGQLYTLLILSIGASESSLGLSILIVYYRLKGGLSLDSINLLKG